MHAYYQATELPLKPAEFQQHQPRSSWLVFASAAVLACFVTLATFAITSQASVSNYVTSVLPRANVMARPSIVYATKKENSPFANPFAKKEVVEEPAKPSRASRRSEDSETALENVARITGVGAKVVSELALYLAFNTAYFVSNTYQFLTEEEQKKLAKQTVDKQLPELLALFGSTTETLGKTASTVAETEDFQDLQKSAAQAVEELTKGLKTENTATPEVLENLKKIVADEKGEVLSEERKDAIVDTLKKGGVKATELSLYLFYNLFTVLRNLDKVLPTAEQAGGIEGKIEDLEQKVLDLASQVKELPQQSTKIVDKVEDLKAALPTAEDLANIDPAEVSLSVRSALATTKEKLDEAVSAVNKALAEDSEFRKTLDDVNTKLKPVTDAVGSLVAKLPLPKKVDGTVDYSKLLADTGIITVKGLKALIEATKKAAGSVSAKTEQ